MTTTLTKKNAKSMANNDLHALFVDGLRDILWAEKELVKTLPKMAKAAQSEELQKAISSHLEETKGHVARLGEVFESLGLSARAKKCAAMAGIIEEGEELVEEFGETHACDAALIAAAQKVEHYEIATYGTLRAFAKRMGHDEAAALLDETLQEEGAADQKLTTVAETMANAAAEEED